MNNQQLPRLVEEIATNMSKGDRKNAAWRKHLAIDFLFLQFQQKSENGRQVGRNDGYNWDDNRLDYDALRGSIEATISNCQDLGIPFTLFPQIHPRTVENLKDWYSKTPLWTEENTPKLRCPAARGSLEALADGRIIFNSHCYEPNRFEYDLNNQGSDLRSTYQKFLESERSFGELREECRRCCLLYQMGLGYPF
jgi:hypothetical protein